MLRHRFTAPVFFGMVAACFLAGASLFARLLASGGWSFAERALFAVFALLFGYLAFGFCHALVGACRRWLRMGRRIDPELPASPAGNGRVALVMPVFNEPVGRVFRGLRATFRSVCAQPDGHAFDVHVLSDSDRSGQWLAEERAWLAWLAEEGIGDRVFYRRRISNSGRKAGNVAEFCRESGGSYEFMVVLDADSVMTGETLCELRRRMIASPRVALIQTVPRLVGGRSLYGRVQQFANRLYGPVFMEGLDYWQAGGGNFWGHNAILRMRPFADECALPELPGPEPFGGPILSHDFVESGLLCRAGWEVRLAPELVGSYEEGPQSMIDAARRDRRWCQGNLQHAILLAARGFRWRTRVHFLNGIMGYLASPLWLLLMVLAVLVMSENGGGDPRSAARLLAVTAGLLFLPKLLCLLDLLRDPPRCRAFGGFGRACAGALLETLFSAFVAPVNMAFHTRFVFCNLMGRTVTWDAQERGANGTPWHEAWNVHGGHVLLGVALGALWWSVGGPGSLLLASPVVLGLLLSVPVSVASSRVQRWASNWFLSPEETAPPEELREALAGEASDDWVGDDFEEVLADPVWNAAHLALLGGQGIPVDFAVEDRVLEDDPRRLAESERMSLLSDGAALGRLHLRLWQLPAEKLPPVWRSVVDRLVAAAARKAAGRFAGQSPPE